MRARCAGILLGSASKGVIVASLDFKSRTAWPIRACAKGNQRLTTPHTVNGTIFRVGGHACGCPCIGPVHVSLVDHVFELVPDI